MAFLEFKHARIVGIAAAVPKNVLKNEGDAVESKDYDAAYHDIDEEINTFRDYFAFTVTPTIFIVKDGVVVADTAKTGRMTIDDLTEWLNKNL